MKINNSLKFYILNIFGFILILSYIWIRFLRSRLPRDIPFDLTLITLSILIITCIIFIIILKQIIKPNISDSTLKEVMILFYQKCFLPLINKMKEPIDHLDFLFRNILLIKHIFHKMAHFLRIIFYEKSYLIRNIVYFFIVFCPKFTILFFLCIDIYIYSKLFYFYKVIILSLIPLGFNYIVYSLNKYLNEYITFLETYYEVDIIRLHIDPECDLLDVYTPDGNLKFLIKTFLNMQYGYSSSYNDVKYKCTLTWNLVDKYFPSMEPSLRIFDDFTAYTEKQRIIMEKDFYELIPPTRDMYNFCTNYNSFLKRLQIIKIVKILNIILYTGYLICWLYILVVSLHTFHLTSIEINLLKNWQDIYEPFSNFRL